MELTETSVPATTQLHGADSGITIPGGKTLRIETTPDGVEILNTVLPALAQGKQWSLSVGLDLREVDS
jgi:hypothetical protein